MTDKYYVEDLGTDVIVDCGCGITGATDTKLMVLKPDGSTAEWAATLDGTNHLKHTTIIGDFSVAGTYYLQASLTLGDWTGLGETIAFRIYDPYK